MKHDRWVNFTAGKQVHITVTSQAADPRNDVDLHVYQNEGLVALDESIGPNSLVIFNPRVSGQYKLEVRNLGNVPATCQVRVR